MQPNILASIGTASLTASATGVLIPSTVAGTGAIDSSQTDWLAVQLTISATATVVAECSFDNGTTWATVPVVNETTGAVAASITATGIYVVHAIGLQTRLRVTANTGTVSLLGGSTEILNDPVVNPTATGSNIVGGVWAGTGAAPSAINTNSAASTNLTSTKATGGQLYEISVSNTSAAVCYLKLYSKSSAPVLGTDVPVVTIPVPANGFVEYEFGTNGKRFTGGIAWALTGLQADNDTTAVAAGIHVHGTFA